MRILTPDDYEVGWICALPWELAASMTMLDEEHQILPRDPHDHNVYTLGSIGDHNVVMACLPVGKLGTASAATVVVQMRTRFRSIRFGLMVGIGGGVPSSKDIRLGDIVVSKPGSRGGGVIQYDYGRTVGQGQFVRTGSLDAPPELLLSALSKLQAKHHINETSISDYISAASTANPAFAYLGADRDLLFESDYRHQGGRNCANCDRKRLVNRSARRTSIPTVHYGLIASANTVMKDAITRDNLANELGALCFEMEAAGLMTSFPCVVIRGISDYSDSHKTSEWRRYAALTAAAYGKELLSIIPPENVVNLSSSPPPPVANQTKDFTPSSAVSKQTGMSGPSILPHAFFSGYMLFPPNTVALERLVANCLAPEHDYCPVPIELTRDDVTISYKPSLRDTIESARGSNAFYKFEQLLSTLKIKEWQLPSVQETIYTLLNSGEVFKRICRNSEVREWLEEQVKRNRSIYMITGIHTVLETDVYSTLADRSRVLGSIESVIGSPAESELVFATRYRKVRFNLCRRGEPEDIGLQMGRDRWKVISLGGRTAEKGDVIEASLADGFVYEEFEGCELEILNDRLFVF